jgi:3-isopropylmalate/(R)-2-methylmalate dehydratase large subunit
MGMTMAEKILASRSGNSVVRPGEYVWANVDGTGVFGPIPLMDKLGITEVFDRERIYAVNDHFAPSPTIAQANAHKVLKDFATKHRLRNYFEHGRHGILHQVFPENGYVSPGDLIVSVDSHSTSYGCFNALGTPINEELAFVVITGMLWLRVPETIRFMLTGKLPSWCVGKDVMLKICGDYGTDCAVYKSVEFLGPAVKQLSLGSRFTMANMGVEIGAKCAIFEADDVTYEFLNGRMKREPKPVSPDADAVYEATHVVDVTDLEPMVALPHDPSNTKTVSEVEAMDLAVDQAFLGSCTNARVEDIAVAAQMLRGRKVHKNVRMIVTPASSEVWRDCAKLGYWEILAEAGAMITNAGCGACPGGHLGLLADQERCISSSNRNFQGRMGSAKAEICLASPATVTASAIEGKIADPRKYLEDRDGSA